MGTMNTKRDSRKVLNHEGGQCFRLRPLEDLFTKMLGSFYGEDTHYETRNPRKEFDKLVELIEQVKDEDKEYVLMIAELGRRYGVINYPLKVLTACYNLDRYKGHNFIGDWGTKNGLAYYSNEIIRRALDVTEILATQKAMYPHLALPMQLRKNLKKKVETFDTFKLSKGLSKKRTISLKDAFCLLRPKPANEELEKAYRSIMEGDLTLGAGKAQIRTELSRQDLSIEKLKEAVYKATLQNIVYSLRSLYNRGVFEDQEVLFYVCCKLQSKEEVLKSKLLPFRFFSAYKELEKLGANDITTALEASLAEAVDISVDSVDNLSGNSCILIDVSGSMDSPISQKSEVTALEIASLLGAMAYKKGQADLYIFGTECKRVTASPKIPVLSLVNQILVEQYFVGYGTDINKAFRVIDKFAKETKSHYNNLIVLTDGDCYTCNDLTDNKIVIGEYSWGWSSQTDSSADVTLSKMALDGVIKKVWVNNLLGNSHSIIDTFDHDKNLATGFSEKFINIINIYNNLDGKKDIRKTIKALLNYDKRL